MFKKPNSTQNKTKRQKSSDANDDDDEVVIKRPKLEVKEEEIDVFCFVLLIRRKNKKD